MRWHLTQEPFPDHPVTRAGALERLAQFVPVAGGAYAQGRNQDHGAGGHDAVSRLSAAIRRRSVTEAEVLAPVLARHGDAAEKFVSEVFWRSYFKGWLETRPAVWTSYLASLDRIEASMTRDHLLAARYLDALDGNTGIDCFDHWAQELRTTGYLHNWARMQFASIWIFTLRLPWELGARFFLDMLVDGDPASNTLSWRWVAGLHTRGKTYLADAARITRMTDGRFAPRGLATVAQMPDEPPPGPAQQPRQPAAPDRARASVVWITPDDCSLEGCAGLRDMPIRAVAIIAGPEPAGHGVRADLAALDDALARAQVAWNVPAYRLADPSALCALAAEVGAAQVVTGYATTGPGYDCWHDARAALRQTGIALTEQWRQWDQQAWPHATRGFFAMRAQIPQLLARSGVEGHL